MKIAFVGQPEYFRIHYRDMLTDDEHECVEIPIAIDKPETYSQLLGEDFDIVFFFRGEFCPPDVAKHITGKKVAISSEPFPKVIDDKVKVSDETLNRLHTFKRILPLNFDYIYHYDKTSIPYMEADGVKVDGEFYLPISKPFEKESLFTDDCWDVCFVGRSTNYRESLLGLVKRDFKTVHINHGVTDELLQAICQRSKIVLNLGVERMETLNPRLQHMMSYGCFVISEPLSHYDTLNPKKHFACTRIEKIYEAIKYFIEHEDITKCIAIEGQREVAEKLDSKTCWKRLIEEISK